MTDDELIAQAIAAGKLRKLAPVSPQEPTATIKRKQVKPNWEMQRRYDEAHGTDNGYDPRIEAWKREF